MFAKLEDLLTESDVEQKLVWPLLTAKLPSGLGYTASDIVTKLSTRRLEIGKGTTRKFYYPDYLVVLAGLPLIVVEAKAPEVPVRDGLDEARLYGVEINALFPSGVNPCFRVMACNGHELVSAPLDTSEPDIVVSHRELSASGGTAARRPASATP
jgi:type I site-specific restriction endonuclease